ncbi:hypothetical protein FF1_042582 [Malus domestica]
MDGEREPEVWSSWLIILAGRWIWTALAALLGRHGKEPGRASGPVSILAGRWIWTALAALLGRHGKEPGRASGPVSLPMVAARETVESALNSVGVTPPLSTESLGDEVEVERSNDRN